MMDNPRNETRKPMNNPFRYLLLVCVMLSGILLGACSDGDEHVTDEPEPETPYLTVAPATFDETDADGAVLRATVASNRAVEVESSAEWCEAVLLPDTERDNLEITVRVNPDEERRQATVTVRAAECRPVEIVVEQRERKPGPFLVVSPAEFAEVPVEGATLTATLATNRSGVQLSCDGKWCAVSYNPTLETDNITLTVAPNDGPGRTAIVTVSAAECEPVAITVAQAERLDDACELLAFSIERSLNPNLKQTIDFRLDAKTSALDAMYLKWIEGAEPEMMIPSFEFEGARVTVDGREIVSGETSVSFADDVTLVVEAANGDRKTYEISLNCPQINRELAVLHMRPSSLITGKQYYVQTEVELYDKTPASTGGGWWNTAENGKTIEMRGRGNSTWGLPKKPFRMKFPEKFSPIGLDHAKAKSWVLLAHDMDKSLIRNHIAFEYSRLLFNSAEGYHDPAAVLFTAASKYVNVYYTGDYYYSDTGRTEHLEGEYLGVYQMSDQMERAAGRIEVDKLDDQSPAEDISGGYIVETDIHEGDHYSAVKRIKMTYKYPKDDECRPEQYDYITDFIGKAEQALYSSNYKDPQNGWRKWFDEKTLADFIIVKELAGDLDGYTSTYCYKRRGIDKFFFGPIWDCDKGWNNDKRVPHSQYRPLSSLMIHAGFWMPSYVENDWFWRFWSDETFRAFVAERWAARRDELVALTYRELDRMSAGMAKAVEANFTVWPFYYQYSDEANMPARTYAEEIERIRTLTAERARLLDVLLQ